MPPQYPPYPPNTPSSSSQCPRDPPSFFLSTPPCYLPITSLMPPHWPLEKALDTGAGPPSAVREGDVTFGAGTAPSALSARPMAPFDHQPNVCCWHHVLKCDVCAECIYKSVLC